jgi:hypothetical protein|tara:strand:- start:112 stop:492 length:381 start_codon:yes stop_codon:yes gene_type:complete
VINEDAPTMSAGTGGFSGSAAATGPVAGFDPMLGKGKKVKKRKYKPKGHVVTNVGIGESMSYFPYRVQYDDSQDYILYGKSEAEIKIELRKAYRPEMFKKITVTRLYPNEVVKFYYNKRMAALKGE